LSTQALSGKRIGLWLGNSGVPEVDAITQTMQETLVRLGATVTDVELPGLDTASADEFAALLVEFKHDINAYLAGLPGTHPADLAGLIRFNRAHAKKEMPYFKQEIFESAQATSGDLTDPDYRANRAAATAAAQNAIDATLTDHNLDAIVAPTNGPPWLTVLGSGDSVVISSSSPAAIAGYPNLTVPAGFIDGALPIGVSFFGARFSEPTLLEIGYAFEQATLARVRPKFLTTLP
jgi:amidase